MIYFFGDTHGQLGHVIDIVQRDRPAAIVLLGDVQAPCPLHQALAPILSATEIWFIPGNHDTDSDVDHDHLFHSELAHRNLHGRVALIDGQRVAGLGGVFRGKVWQPPAPALHHNAHSLRARTPPAQRWRDGPPRQHRSSIFPDDYAQLARQRADILVTHEAPSAHPYGFAAIDELARSLRVGKAFHGHHHDSLDYRPSQPRLGFAAYGVGLRGVSDQNGQCIQPGQQDHARRHRTVD